VGARCELDLRLGAAFTRLQTLTLQGEYEGLDQILSYGPCQFPTMWFVVQRAKRIEAFVQVCIYIYIYTHTHIYIHTYAPSGSRLSSRHALSASHYTNTHISISIYTFMYTYIHTYVGIYMFI